MLLNILIIELMAMGVDANIFATLAPPFHNPDGRSRTILVCLVSDFLHNDVEVTWLSSGSKGSSDYITYNVAKEEDGTHSAISLIEVASHEWDSYTCFVNYKSTAMLIRKHYADLTENDLDNTCYADLWNVTQGIQNHSESVFILALRILLWKSIIFNFMMTVILIMEW